MAGANRAVPGADTPLQIAEGLDVVLISADEALIQFGHRSAPSELLRDSDLKGMLGQLFGRLLGGPATLNELLGQLPPAQRGEARELIAGLFDRGILTDARASPVDQYLRYTFEGAADLAARRAVLLGAGPLGARIAHSLLQQGVGQLGLLDERAVDRHWHMFAPLGLAPGAQAGRPAHAALCEHLLAAGHSGVEALGGQLDPAGLEAAVSGADLVVLAFEQPQPRVAHLVNRFCLRAQTPWVHATIDGNVGLVGPLFLPPHTACYNDYAALSELGGTHSAMGRAYRQHVRRRGAGTFFPGLPSYAEIVAGYTALASIHYLLGEHSFALGRVMAIDFDRMTIDVEDVLKLPRCPVCGMDKPPYRPPFE